VRASGRKPSPGCREGASTGRGPAWRRGGRAGLALLAACVIGGALASRARADVIHLTNGGTIQADAWRDAGDAIEFARGGGIIRIPKGDIQRIEGNTRTDDLRMRSAPPGATVPATASGALAAAREMVSLLKEGEALFMQTVLDAQAKASAFRRLVEKWRALEAPDSLRDVRDRGERALQVSSEAFTAEAEGAAPDAKERIEAARKTFADVLAEVEGMTKEG
jgi:hypothetical protein